MTLSLEKGVLLWLEGREPRWKWFGGDWGNTQGPPDQPGVLNLRISGRLSCRYQRTIEVVFKPGLYCPLEVIFELYGNSFLVVTGIRIVWCIHFIHFRIVMRALWILTILKRCFIWNKIKRAYYAGCVETEWVCESGESTLSFQAWESILNNLQQAAQLRTSLWKFTAQFPKRIGLRVSSASALALNRLTRGEWPSIAQNGPPLFVLL